MLCNIRVVHSTTNATRESARKKGGREGERERKRERERESWTGGAFTEPTATQDTQTHALSLSHVSFTGRARPCTAGIAHQQRILDSVPPTPPFLNEDPPDSESLTKPLEFVQFVMQPSDPLTTALCTI